MAEMKHYIDIENLRDETIDLGNGLIRERNDQAFQKDDIIQITEKIDGANASIRYDAETGKIKAFSRKQELSWTNTLNGFFNFVQGFCPEDFADVPNYVIFGEWLLKNKILYDLDKMKRWYVYSIWDDEKEVWLEQTDVEEFCKEKGLLYVHELYCGPFKSWEHCREFLHSPAYGERQEGIVVRNISALRRGDHFPHILKIVNEDFKETNGPKFIDPEKEAAKEKAKELISNIVTRNRVEKMLLKLRDEQIIPEKLTPKDMGTVAKNLPKRIFEDCLKEEPEIVQAAGEYAGKCSGAITMKLAKEIILGK